jgi:fatty-acyl-CoA synthase
LLEKWREKVSESIHRTASGAAQVLTNMARFASRPAIADGSIHWTYAELGEATGRTIAVFKALGLKRGDALAILATNRADVLALMLAANLMGMRYTPLHPLAAEDDHAFIVDDARIDILVAEPHPYGARAMAIRARVPSLKHVFALGPMDGLPDLYALAEAATPGPLRDESVPTDLSALVYTGGTTGRPKGVMHTHRSIQFATLLMAADWDWPTDIRFLATTPISHAAGGMLRPVMFKGGYSRLLQGFDPEIFCRTIEEERITCTMLVPTLIYALLDHPAARSYDLSSLQMLIYGAAPMSAERLRQAIDRFGPIFVQLYGQTEAPNCIATLRRADHDVTRADRLGSCGLPCPGVEVRLLDTAMDDVPTGQPGEICVRGPLVMEGYWQQPAATEDAFRGGWLHTGDVAIRDADGYLTIVDRTRDMIISGGFNIYPREVEDALMSHPAVSGAAVIGVPDEKWGEAVTALVVLRETDGADPDQLKAHVRALRGAPWSPKTIHFLESLPVTPLGKIDRKTLRARYWAGSPRNVS